MCDLIVVNREKVLKMFDKTEESITGDIKILRDWLNQQPHLPNIDDARLESILLSRKFSIERAKSTIDHYFTKRNEAPEFFENRNPCSEESRKSIQCTVWLPLKYPTENCERISISRLFTDDLSEINGLEYFKYNFFIEDILLKYDYNNGHHVIFDLINFKLIHLSIFTPALLAKSTKTHLDAYGVRLAGIHFLNPPPFMDTIIVIIKTFLKDKILKRVQIHKNLDSLYAVIPKKLLPIQYGGECGDIVEIRDQWKEYIESMKSWFEADSKLKTDESKRPISSNNNNFDSIDGTFKKLDID